MSESSAKGNFHKYLIFGACGLMILAEAIRMIVPNSVPTPPKQIIEEAQALPPERRTQTNPETSWLEKQLCRGLQYSSFCSKKSTRHPLLKHLES
jgi:hypothetical protein